MKSKYEILKDNNITDKQIFQIVKRHYGFHPNRYVNISCEEFVNKFLDDEQVGEVYIWATGKR